MHLYFIFLLNILLVLLVGSIYCNLLYVFCTFGYTSVLPVLSTRGSAFNFRYFRSCRSVYMVVLLHFFCYIDTEPFISMGAFGVLPYTTIGLYTRWVCAPHRL